LFAVERSALAAVHKLIAKGLSTRYGLSQALIKRRIVFARARQQRRVSADVIDIEAGQAHEGRVDVLAKNGNTNEIKTRTSLSARV
jgi:methylaspartate ammonia-lyase